ncbi:hypothetical protein RSAG8_08982, partial [Rhizoctonia solani AG-8 WAC10335]
MRRHPRRDQAEPTHLILSTTSYGASHPTISRTRSGNRAPVAEAEQSRVWLTANPTTRVQEFLSAPTPPEGPPHR